MEWPNTHCPENAGIGMGCQRDCQDIWYFNLLGKSLQEQLHEIPSHPSPIPSPVSPGKLVVAKIRNSLQADTVLLLPAHPIGKKTGKKGKGCSKHSSFSPKLNWNRFPFLHRWKRDIKKEKEKPDSSGTGIEKHLGCKEMKKEQLMSGIHLQISAPRAVIVGIIRQVCEVLPKLQGK